jgi:3-deoxy-D-manno-octulosonate 8-phosphate phosphatase (KDO 8-P phosphatase)
MRELGVAHVIQGAGDKHAALAALLDSLGVAAEHAACLVDDLPDLPMMRMVGLPAAVADAHPDVLAAAGHVTGLAGGHGAVREFCDWLLARRAPAP